MLNGWNIDVNTQGMPQKVATAFDALMERLLGAEYSFIAYLGSQQVNGVNHAILAEQVLTTGRDTTNVVLIVLNEREGGFAINSIETVVAAGGALGGVAVAPTREIPEDAQGAWNRAFEGFVGSDVRPFAVLGTKVTKGLNYIFAAEIFPVGQPLEKRVTLVVVNDMAERPLFVDILPARDSGALGYAFTWL